MTLGNRLRLQRKSLGLSQSRLAALAGIQANAQGHYENGTRTPRADYLESLSSIGLDVYFILMGISNPDSEALLTQDESTVIKNLRRLSPADRQAVERLLAVLSATVKAKAVP